MHAGSQRDEPRRGGHLGLGRPERPAAVPADSLLAASPQEASADEQVPTNRRRVSLPTPQAECHGPPLSCFRGCGAETFVNFASFERDGKLPYNWYDDAPLLCLTHGFHFKMKQILAIEKIVLAKKKKGATRHSVFSFQPGHSSCIKCVLSTKCSTLTCTNAIAAAAACWCLSVCVFIGFFVFYLNPPPPGEEASLPSLPFCHPAFGLTIFWLFILIHGK